MDDDTYCADLSRGLVLVHKAQPQWHMLIRGVLPGVSKSDSQICCFVSNARSIAMGMGNKKIAAVLAHSGGFGMKALESRAG